MGFYYKTLFFIPYLCSHLFVFSQTDENNCFLKRNRNTIHHFNEVIPPEFKDKNFDLSAFFNQHFKYDGKIEPNTYIEINFIVERNGRISFIPSIDTPINIVKEIKKTLKKLPKFKPAMLDNRKVRCLCFIEFIYCHEKKIFSAFYIRYKTLTKTIDVVNDGDVICDDLRRRNPCDEGVEHFKIKEGDVYFVVQQMPEFSGGHDSMNLFIEKT